MNSIRNSLGMRKTGNGGNRAPEDSHANAVFTQVHNTVWLFGHSSSRLVTSIPYLLRSQMARGQLRFTNRRTRYSNFLDVGDFW